MRDDAATRELLRAGRLEQECPADCRQGWRRTNPGPEAAGAYCTACTVKTGPPSWRRADRSEAQRAAIERARATGQKETPRAAVSGGSAA